MKIEELSELDDLQALERLTAEIWGSAGLLNTDTLRALAHSGNFVAGARSADGRRLIGGAVGWLGRHADGAMLLHSHVLGVLPGDEAKGLGFALKQRQRAWCLERGVRTIEWTFDPLVRRNAYFNLNKLGADAAEYLVEFYGAMHDGINSGDESDRILVRWALDSPRAVAAADGKPAGIEIEDARATLQVGQDGEPVVSQVDGPATCEVPEDIVAVRRATPERALRWRRALRQTLGAHLMGGGRVRGVTPAGVYVLDRGAG